MEPADFQAVFESSPNPYMLIDREFRFVAANPAYVRVTATALDQLVGRNVFDAFPHDPDNRANENARLLRESFERVLATRSPDVLAVIPYRVPIERDGTITVEERLWSATHVPLLDERGEVRLILQHTVDITEQRTLEAEREALLERQRFLTEAIPQHVWTADASGTLTSVNRRVLEYFGVTAEDMLGSDRRRFVHPDDLDHTMAQWAEALRTGQEYEVEFRLRRADGVYRWHLARAVAAYDASGSVARWFGTNTDIDDRKRAQDEIVRRSAYEQQLIGIVSHDLRNPINAIVMAAALLSRPEATGELQTKAVTRIVSSADRARRLLRDFLDFAQARSLGSIPVVAAPSNIRQIARQVFEEVRGLHPSRRATIAHHGPEDGTWDADRLAQLIGNLLSNAFQHSPADASVRLHTHGTDDEVVIEVQNEGAPIPPEDIARFFQPFEQGAGTQQSLERSVGLGLFITKQIVAAHNGTIDVRSTQEEGTVFTVRLPRHLAS